MSEKSQENSQPLYRAKGVTESERYLNKLAKRSFLSLWTYPSLFNNKGQHQELCDLLVVFDNHVIIFSDKDCEFPDTGNLDTDWKRWYKKAIYKSAKQVWGAERWIKEFPERIFLDPACTQPFPLNLPSPDNMIVHRIVVAHGASERCRKHFGGGSGSLLLDTSILNDEHPFALGEIEPNKGFIHIFDDASLDFVLQTLDTITDFVEYLAKKEQFLQNNKVLVIGEENLVGLYLATMNQDDEHDFVGIDELRDSDKFVIRDGIWNNFVTSNERYSQVQANKISVLWDDIIETFNKDLLDETWDLAPLQSIKEIENALHFLAKESRTLRRGLSEALLQFIGDASKKQRAVRVVVRNEPNHTSYVFMTFPLDHDQVPPNYEYRQLRSAVLAGCCHVLKLEYPHLNDIVGIATEPGIDNGGRSYDLAYLDGRKWTEQDRIFAIKTQNELGILKNHKIRPFTFYEYPVTDSQKQNLPQNVTKRNDPCYCGSGKKYKHCCRKREQRQRD